MQKVAAEGKIHREAGDFRLYDDGGLRFWFADLPVTPIRSLTAVMNDTTCDEVTFDPPEEVQDVFLSEMRQDLEG